MTLNRPICRKQTGLSLVELMVSMAIGLLLLAGTMQMFVANKQVYRTTEALSHVQESGRFAFEFLARTIRMADFWGCQVDTSDIVDHIDHTTTSGVSYIDSWNSGGLAGEEATGWGGSDKITLRGGFGGNVHVVQLPATTSAAIKVTNGAPIEKGDLFFVTDCQSGELFAVTDNTGPLLFDNIGHNTGNNGSHAQNATKVFQKKYGPDASVYEFGEVVFELRIGASGEPGLFQTYNGTTQELVSGISDMQITYGVDNGGDGNIDWYGNATAVTNWNEVVTVRVDLTARSPERNVIIDADADSADNRMEQTYTTTISLRNRLG